MYIPKNRIITNLYSNDNKLVYKANQEFYTGFYYKTFDGKYFTGKTPNDPPNVELELVEDTENTFTPDLPQNELAYTDAPTIFNNIDTPGYNEEMVITYARLQGIDLNKSTRKFLPYQCYPQPTIDDYELGSFIRYFCVKINQPIYFELDKKIYGELKNQSDKYLWEPYIPFSIQWTLAGDRNYVETTNSNIVRLHEKRSKRVGLGKFLKYDFLKFYL